MANDVTKDISDDTRTEIAQLASLLLKHKDRVAVFSPGCAFAVKSLIHCVQDAGLVIRCELEKASIPPRDWE